VVPLNFDPQAMSDLLLTAVIAFGVIGLVFWLIDAADRGRRQAKQQREQKKLEDKRRREEVIRTVRETAPELAALRKAVTVLHDFVAHANAYRPKFIRPDELSFRHVRFRQVRFSFPFDVFFPRNCEGSTDGPDPEPWVTTVDNLLVPKAHELRSIYTTCMNTNTFPCSRPILSFNPPASPEYPQVELPLSDIQIVPDDAGKQFLARLRKLFTLKLSQAWKLQEATNQLHNEFEEQKRKAEEARDLMDIYIANEMLAYREMENSLLTEFNLSKRNYEQQSDEQLAPIRSVYKEYATHTRNGIERHFHLALRTLALPIPSTFPWSTFYDPNDSLLQINQRVPFIADIVVKRADSKRAPSKRDTDNFLRRLVPAVSLHIAQHVALNDLYDDVDTIAINCWCRYFERTTGRLKNAFVSSLKVQKKDILQIDINKADALDAFRALRGAYVYSTQDIVPIEPQIRLDKKDDRFVEGKEVLEGMAQGQNLATMDWQDFEHLIRELLAKEFGGKEGSEVRITRASRDRGVDAVIFDPDPLRGGKSVVQAKRYNNVVDVSAVRDLWGTVLNEGAARGILVTTSKYGRDAYDFASNKPLTLLEGQHLLALLAKHGFKFKIELG
jgi:restriction system protein